MKSSHILLLLIPVALLGSCVSKKKYTLLSTEARSCRDQLTSANASIHALNAEKVALQATIDELRKTSNQVLGTLQDMSVISGKQAESIKQSLENLGQKDAYIMNLQNAMTRKDSLNMLLVMNLKSSLADVNDQDVNIKVDKGVVFIDISDKLLFNSGKYAVTDRAGEVLGKVARVLNAHPDVEFMVEGHTDNVPIHNECIDDNWDLSTKRAAAVIRILEKKYKIKPSRMTAAGHSEYSPIGSNETAEGRATNRRTRIVILPQLDQFFQLMEGKK